MEEFEQISLFDYISETDGDYKFPKDKRIRLIELFGGIGSQSMCMERLNPPQGWEPYRLVEFDKYCVASYNAIHGTNFVPTDITKIHGRDLGIVDKDKYSYLMVYSFPCQSLSVAGKMHGMSKGSGTRSGLLWEVERLLDETPLLPDVLLMENVSNIVSKKFMADFQLWLDYLETKGYSSYWQVMNAADFGVAQSRKRCFCVSVLGNHTYKFPKPIPLTKVMKDYLEPEVDEKYYIKSERARELIEKLIIGGKIVPTGNKKALGELGVGGERGIVYGVDDVSPCQSATQYKDANKILEITEPDVNCVDLCFEHGAVIDKANAIAARYDAGVVKHKYEHSGVCEVSTVSTPPYVKNEQSTLHSTTQGLISPLQTALVQEPIGEYQSNHQKEVESLKLQGCLNDESVHQSNKVYDPDGLSRTIDASEFKHPQMITEWKELK